MPDVTIRVATEFDVVAIRLSKDATARVERLTTESKCLGCEQPFVDGERVTCGQCSTCYNAAHHAISKRRVTRISLIREGKMLPPGKGGRKPANDFTASLGKGGVK